LLATDLAALQVYVKALGASSYYRGREKEYRVLRSLRSEGWLCSRSAASHSPADIFAAKDGHVLIIQVKSGRARVSGKEKETLRAWGKAYGARVEIWHFKGRKGIEREVVCECSRHG